MIKNNEYVMVSGDVVDFGEYEYTRGEHWFGKYTLKDTIQPIDSLYIKNYGNSKLVVKDKRHYLIKVENVIENVCFEFVKKKYLFDNNKIKTFIDSTQYTQAMRALGLKELEDIKIQINYVTGVVIMKKNETVTLEQFIVDHLNTDVAHKVP